MEARGVALSQQLERMKQGRVSERKKPVYLSV